MITMATWKNSEDLDIGGAVTEALDVFEAMLQNGQGICSPLELTNGVSITFLITFLDNTITKMCLH